MKIVRLEQNYRQELNGTVDLEVEILSQKKKLNNVQCYNQFLGLFSRCLGWSLTVHHIDKDGIVTLYFIKKESLLKNASIEQIDVKEIAKQSVLWVNEKND